MSQEETVPTDERQDGSALEKPVDDGDAGQRGGFKAQPPWLRFLLIVSVTAMIIGIVRCSIESTAPVAQAVSSVAVMPVRVQAPDGFFTQPGDSVAIMAAKWFTRSFARESGIQVDIIRSEDEIPGVLREDAPYDGLAYFTLERSYDAEKEEYRLLIHGEIVHTETKRAMAIVDYDAPPSFLYRRMTEAGEDVARRMGYAPGAEAEAEG